MIYHITSGRSRDTGYSPREYGWKCSCGKRSSGWFASVARRDVSRARHEATHAS